MQHVVPPQYFTRSIASLEGAAGVVPAGTSFLTVLSPGRTVRACCAGLSPQHWQQRHTL